jgi:glucose/arabinose dehydrogenase
LFISVPLACLVSLSSAQARQALTGAAAFGGWKSDAPGVRRHIRPSDLPPPATGKDPEGSIAKIVKVVEAPKGALPKLPDGFAVQVFASGFKMPRTLRSAPNGDFMTGFVVDDNTVWGRPAGLAVTRDGALLVSDDANGTIFRVTRKASQ